MDTKAKHVPVNLEHVLFYKLHGFHHPDLNVNVVDVTNDSSNITNGKQSRKQKVAVWNAAKHYSLRGIVIVMYAGCPAILLFLVSSYFFFKNP